VSGRSEAIARRIGFALGRSDSAAQQRPVFQQHHRVSSARSQIILAQLYSCLAHHRVSPARSQITPAQLYSCLAHHRVSPERSQISSVQLYDLLARGDRCLDPDRVPPVQIEGGAKRGEVAELRRAAIAPTK